MIQHPDFFDVRKIAIALACGPLVFLLLLVGIDVSLNQWRIGHIANNSCVKVESPVGIMQPNGNNCSASDIHYTSQK